MSFVTLRGIFPGTWGTQALAAQTYGNLEAILTGPMVNYPIARSKFGFRAYDQLAKRRALAIEYPAAYLDAKRTRIVGGPRPAAVGVGADAADRAEFLYGPVNADGNVVGVADEVARVYSETLQQLYDAGASQSVAEKYATSVAQATMDSRLAIVESEFPDIIDSTSEKNLLLNTLGTVGGRIAMGTPKPKGITYEKREK